MNFPKTPATNVKKKREEGGHNAQNGARGDNTDVSNKQAVADASEGQERQCRSERNKSKGREREQNSFCCN